MSPGRIAVHGHRGARAAMPENTLAGFRYAIEAGADAIELDLLATADDVLVACHDPVLRRAIFAGPPGCRIVREMTLAELSRWRCGGHTIPTLAEVLSLAAGSAIRLDLELKYDPARPRLFAPPERMAALLAAAVNRCGLAGRVLALSFDLRVLAALAREAPAIRRGALYQFGARGFVSAARAAGAMVAAPYFRLVTRRRVETAHDAGMEVLAWTANRADDWDWLARAGVDAVVTDDPARMLAWLRWRDPHSCFRTCG